jgi:glycine cleavage system T protein (aminomethyltransferase)
MGLRVPFRGFSLAEAAAVSTPLRDTPLAALHRAAGARMVPFAGYAMPVQYPTGILTEHAWTREHAGLFDVSHMGPAFLSLTQPTGEPAADHAAVAAIVEQLTCADVRALPAGAMRYTLLLNEHGGILDDLMVGRLPHDPPGRLYLVVNAATKEADFARIERAALGAASFDQRPFGLLALQGPEAGPVIATLVPDAVRLGFMQVGVFVFAGVSLIISRSGYTGEDGFEILVAADHAAALWSRLLQDPRVKPVGLGARDSLRLEAGLPLYGHDLDETTSPVEAGLSFAVARRRREAADFPGANRILTELSGAPERVRVGLLVEGGAPAREGADVLDPEASPVGRVTSGGFSPTLKRAIALAFVPPPLAGAGTRLAVSVRGRVQPATVTSLPFVPHRYVRKPRG